MPAIFLCTIEERVVNVESNASCTVAATENQISVVLTFKLSSLFILFFHILYTPTFNLK